MNETSAETTIGWGAARSSRRRPIRLRDVLPPLAAVAVLFLAHLLFGATQPLPALAVSAILVGVTVIGLVLAGPRQVTPGMLVGAGVIWAFGLTGIAGPLDRAAPQLAVLFAAGAVWTIGYIAARRRGALDITWNGLIWSSIAYCTWMFYGDVAASMAGARPTSISEGFESPAQGAMLFGLFAVLALARILHVVKQIDAEAVTRSRMIERVLRDGLSGWLLLGLALTCLVLTGSEVGLLLTIAVLIFHMWWDSLAITGRDHRGIIVRLGAQLAPFLALGLAAWGVGLSWLHDETVAPGAGVGATLSHVQRLEAYMQAWAQKPTFGYGLGSIESVGDRVTTLANAKAMLAPGGAQNVFVTWLVETGVAGLVMLVLALGAMHARIIGAMGTRRVPRTFLRLAVVCGLLLLLHGVTDSSLDIPGVVWVYALLLGAACGVATGSRGGSRADPLTQMSGDM
jgi:O-antigen ligase